MGVDTHTVDTRPDRDRGPAEARPEPARRRAALAVGTIVVVAFVTYGALALAIESPRIFVDELRYWNAAASLASGDGLTIRGESYTYAPLYPLLLAPVLWAAPDRELAYELAKLLKALLFALAAVPLYLLARRLLSAKAAIGVAALSVAVPSAMYVSVVMTESLAYLAASFALYAILLALERPTHARQGAALVAIVAAYAVRPQFAFLLAAYLAGLVLVWLLLPGRRVRWRETLVAFWPTAASLGVTLAVLLAVSPRRALGGYEAVWRSYDPVSVADWLLYHRVLLLFVVLLVAAAFALPRRSARVSVAAVVVVFAVTGQLAWFLAVRDGRKTYFALSSERRWVDERVPDGSTVTLLLGSQGCDSRANVGQSRDRSESFNATIRRAVHVGERQSDLPSTEVRVGRDGQLRLPSEAALEAELVLAPPNIRLEGRRIAEGTTARLGLWEVDGPVRVLGRESIGQLEGSACPG